MKHLYIILTFILNTILSQNLEVGEFYKIAGDNLSLLSKPKVSLKAEENQKNIISNFPNKQITVKVLSKRRVRLQTKRRDHRFTLS